MPDRREQLDSIIRVVTPENIAFEYRVAGPFRRLPAYLIDLLFIGLLCLVVTMVLSPMIVVSAGMYSFILSVTYFAVGWFFGGFCEAMFSGQTPGKWLLGLRTVNYDGLPINGLQAIMRNLVRTADIFLM